MTFWATPKASDWDTLILGGARIPGAVTVDTSKSRTFEQAKRKRFDGVFLSDSGNNASPVTANIVLWTEEHYSDFSRILPNIDPQKQGAIRKPLDIVHPATRLIGVSQVVIKDVKVSSPQNGMLRVTLSMLQWFPQIKKVRSRVQPNAEGSAEPQGIDGYNARGERLTDEDVAVPPSANIGANT